MNILKINDYGNKIYKIPFEVDLAKKISDGEVEGKIVTRDGRSVRIICWDAKWLNKYPICALITLEDFDERIERFTSKGLLCDNNEDIKDLMLKIPEYITFKDGDVIAYDEYPDIFFVIGGRSSLSDENPDYYIKYDKGNLRFGSEGSFCRLKGSRLAKGEEKQKFIDALKSSKETQAKEHLKRFFGIEEKPFEFKPFDKVVVRDLTLEFGMRIYFLILTRTTVVISALVLGGMSAYHTTNKQHIY